AFFVNEIKTVQSKQEIFRLLKSKDFQPSQTAILEEPPAFAIQPSEDNKVELKSFDLHQIKLKASAVAPALLVLSEIYYPAGWKAYVDGKETKIYKTNYILRSIFLQPGEHDIEFAFKPTSFRIGLLISVLTALLLVAGLVYSRRKQENETKK
ncbi:MAG: YfhO family protein, partial [candidate division KSB1 bacterium]|nr:YfhO family protein [candidate division KSB1 bacterium]